MIDNPKILVVDDEPVICDLVEEALIDDGYSIQKVFNVDSAVDKIKEEQFDVIITDWVLPGKGGLDLLREIKTIQPDTRVIIVTAFATINNAVLAMREGASYYLAKPFAPEQVQILVEKTLSSASKIQKLTNTKLQYDTLVNCAPDAIITTDLKGNITKCNTAAEKLIGYSKDSIINESILKIFPREEHFKIETVIECMKNDDIIKDLEISIENSSSDLIPVSVSFSSVTNIDDEIIGAICVFKDLSKQKNLIKELKEANNELQKLDDLKTDFVSSVSHELRTPLAMIKGFASLIRKKPDIEFEKRMEFMQIIENECDRLTRLVDDLLDLSRIESKGEARLVKESVDIHNVIDEVIESLIPTYEDKKITINRNYSLDISTIFVDKDSMKRVIHNLIENAIKFNFEQGEVNINTEEDDQYVIFSIEDTGMGIPNEDLDKIFKKFYRVERPGMEIRGTGLGLSIVKNIIDLYDGKITIKSEVGKSTIVICKIPKMQADKE